MGQSNILKVRQSRNVFFDEFDFTTIIPQVNLFLSVFWKKLKTPKKDILKSSDL